VLAHGTASDAPDGTPALVHRARTHQAGPGERRL